jgi:hypothetical protein
MVTETSREAARLRTAFELFEAGVRLMEARLRRRHANATPAEIEAMLAAWLRDRPGAPNGDAEGLAVDWPPVR